MLTNTFTPHVGGVARSVEAFTAEYRQLGHRVLVVAPMFDDSPEVETDVIRIPAIQHFNGSDFSLPIPVPGLLSSALAEAPPDVVHSHHPFLLGDTALRVAATYNAPVVFTHHTQYDQYTHYLSAESSTLQRIAVEIATGYCNLCQGVIAPSQSVVAGLRGHGVDVPIEVIPTGVDSERFAQGDGQRFRQQMKIPPIAFVVGHVGRLAPEKNLAFLADAVSCFLHKHKGAYFLVVGCGSMEAEIEARLAEHGLADRLRMAGVRQGQSLVDAYHAMDAFAFASQTETQGMVVTEAMAAGVPVVAVEAPGVGDVVVDGQNGRLLPAENADHFAEALAWVAGLKANQRKKMAKHMERTVEHFSIRQCATRALEFYETLRATVPQIKPTDDSAWAAALRWVEEELKILTYHAKAVGGALATAITADEKSEDAP